VCTAIPVGRQALPGVHGDALAALNFEPILWNQQLHDELVAIARGRSARSQEAVRGANSVEDTRR